MQTLINKETIAQLGDPRLHVLEPHQIVTPDDHRMQAYAKSYMAAKEQGTEFRQYDLGPEDVHVNAPLSQILLDYRPTGFIADEIFPIVPVMKQSDLVPIVTKADRFRAEETIRAPGTLPRYIHFTVGSISYFANNRALGTYLTREEVTNADAVWNTQVLRSRLIYDILLLDYEIRVANLVTSGSNCGSYWATGSSWTDWENSAPLTNVLNDLDVAEQLSGYRPNKVIFGRTAWHNFRNADETRASFYRGGVGTPLVNLQMAADILEVEKVLVGGAYKNTAAEGANIALSRVWHDQVLYYYAPNEPSKEMPSFGYAFRWNVEGLPNLTVRTFPWEDKQGRADIHVHLFQDEKVTDSTLGCLRTGVGSSQ